MKPDISLNPFKNRRAEFFYTVLLFLILILAGLLRFYRLDERCLSGDGVITVDIISSPSARAVWNNVTENYRPDFPFFYLILYFWSLLSDNLFWLRSLSVVSGVLLVWVAHRFVRYLFDNKSALLVAYFVSISPLLILHSRSVRYYSLNSLFNLLALYAFFVALRTNRNARWFLYAALRTIAVYINYSSFFFFIAEYVYLLIYRKKYAGRLTKWLGILSIMIVLWIPVFVYLFRDFQLLSIGDGFRRVPIRGGIIGNLFYLFFALSLGSTISPFNFAPVAAGLLIYSYLVFNFVKSYLARKLKLETVNFVLLCLILVLFLCAVSEYNAPRYIKAAAVLFSIIVSLGILNLPKRMAIIIVFSITILRAYAIYNIYTERQYHLKEYVDDWDEIAVYVDGNSNQKDAIIYNSLAFGYYMERVNPKKSKFSMPQDKEEMEIFISEDLDKKDISRVILIDSPLSGNLVDEYAGGLAVLREWLKDKEFRLTTEKGFDYDRTARRKRKYLNRPFPEYRTTVYIYRRN
jgi:hypothetical protein